MRGFDLTEPGAVDALIAFHRSVFGDARMEDAPPSGDAPPADPPQGDPAPTDPPADPAKPTPPAPAPSDANPWDNPDTAKAEIERLRRENAKDRTTAKQTAAQEAEVRLAQKIGKALGLVKDEPVDPAQLTEQLTRSQTQARQAQVQLAVYKAAAAAGGDPAAVLDSASFLAKVANLDPTDANAIGEAIKQAVQDNPRLGAAPSGPTVPAPNPAQGSSGGGPAAPAQLTKADVERMYAAKDYAGIEKARVEGRLNDVLGVTT